MQINCAITGKAIRYTTFEIPKPLEGLHPIFSLDKRALLAIAKELSEATHEESALLFLAFLAKLNTVTISSRISLDSLGQQFCEAQLPLVISACQATPQKLALLPALALTQETINEGGLISWLEFLKEGLTYGQILSLEDTENENAIQYSGAINASKKRARQNFRLVAAWGIDNMLARCPSFSQNGLRSLTQILIEGKPCNLEYMQDLKGRLLDYLPENSPDNSFRKGLILERVDSCIADALLISASLGLHTAQELETQVAAIASTYTIEGMLNTAAAPTKQIKTLQAIAAHQAAQAAQAAQTVQVKSYTLAQIEANPLLAKLYALGKIAPSS